MMFMNINKSRWSKLNSIFIMIIKFFTESTQLRHVSKKKKRLHSCNEEITDFVRADDNSSRSNIFSIIAQHEMKSEKAQAAFNLFREYDYRIECEGKQPGCVDPIRLHFQKKRMQRILAVSKRRKLLISKHQKKKIVQIGKY